MRSREALRHAVITVNLCYAAYCIVVACYFAILIATGSSFGLNIEPLMSLVYALAVLTVATAVLNVVYNSRFGETREVRREVRPRRAR